MLSIQFDPPDPVTEFVQSNTWIMQPGANAAIVYKNDKWAVYEKSGWRKKWRQGDDLYGNEQDYPLEYIKKADKPKDFKPQVNQQYFLHYYVGTQNYALMPGWGISAGNLVACANINKDKDCLEEYVMLIKLLISQPDINALVWTYDGLMTVLCDEDA